VQTISFFYGQAVPTLRRLLILKPTVGVICVTHCGDDLQV